MQFIWLYVDDMLGKGIEWYVIAELLIYSSANLVPLALPLSVLLASLMTFGNLGEHFELVSFKAAGISLQRIMRPLFIFVTLLSLGAFLFANNVVPVANLKFFSLLYDIRGQKPAINIKPGVFYNEIEGYTIRVKEKEKTDDGRELLKDIMIYNHTKNNGNRQLTIADSGIMSISPDKKYFSIKLYNGTDYSETQEQRIKKKYPLTRFSFEENELRISMEGFQFNRSDEDAFKHDYRMFNLKQIMDQTDTLERRYIESVDGITNLIQSSYLFNDTVFYKNNISSNNNSINAKEYMESLKRSERNQVYGIAINNCRTNKGRCGASASEQILNKKSLASLGIEWHRKFAFSLACIVMFFIGAPLGAIVKKGGLGMPVVISVIFFLLFWVLSITGEKMAKEMVILPYQGMWMSFVILLPLGFFFTYKATTDSTMFNLDAYFGVIKKIFTKKTNS
jgi:lipopolysaccharide export system permease protein